MRNWVRVRRVGTPELSKSGMPGKANISIYFEVAPKPPEKWFSLFHEKVGPAREIAGKINTSTPVGAGYRGYVSSTKDGIADAIAKLDAIIEDTNDRFEAFQKEAAEKEAANKAQAAADRQKRDEEQQELDAIAEKFARPPYEPE